MPTVHDFGDFIIYMYFEDHNPPHVHIIGKEFAAKMRISDQVVFVGKAPNKIINEASQYVEANIDRLMNRWNEYSS